MLPAPSHVLVLAVLVTLVDRGSCSAKWGYSGPFGPYNWANVDTSPNVNQCGDKHQSPVDLDDRYAEYDSGLAEINFNGYDQELYNPYIVNNGHTVQISATEDSNRFIEGARLPGRFQFAQFHLHWGANSSRGSEHTVRGFQYPLELHFVHFNAKYGSAAESMKYEDGLAVVAVYFEVSPTANEDLSVVVDALKEVRLSDEKGFNMPSPVVLNRFLPRITRSYYRYQGSLTTPPCSQAVTFLVMTTTVPISEEQLQQFRLLRMGKDENSSLLVDNFRPTFPLNGRRVFKSFPSSAPGLGPEGFPSKPNRKPSGDRGGNRRQQQGPSSRPQGSSRPGSSSSGSRGSRPKPGRDSPRGDGGSSRPRDFPRNEEGPRDSSRNDGGPPRFPGGSPSRPHDRDRGSSSSGRRPQHDDDDDFPRFDGGFSRPRDFPRNDDDRRESSRNDRGPSRSRGDSPSRSQDRDRGTSSSGRRPQHDDFPRGDGGSSRPRDFPRNDHGSRGTSRNDRGPSHFPSGSASRPHDRDRGSSSSGHRPQVEDGHPPRRHGSRDEEGFHARPEYSRDSPNSDLPLRGSNRRDEFPHHERVPSPEDFVVSAGNQQRPRGNSRTQGFQGPEQFPTNQESRGPQQRFPEGPRRNLGPDQLSGSEQFIPGPQPVFPIPEPQPFARDQGFSGGSLELSRPGQVSRPREFPRRQELPDGSGTGFGGVSGPGRG
ncbi:basic salivary proline-rich protein 2 isoform X1 [Rhipicephalus sanguineus]|uniref:basic salivary proline-rich protein 2 isoform X1 n=1 Tax=Rhipicephalus sanguineus TaxID=34632 RepID=UPI0018937AA9|nr:basic salivary proline-rich protein 2 isoform X1 [Rhipicephalus sanguineus]